MLFNYQNGTVFHAIGVVIGAYDDVISFHKFLGGFEAPVWAPKNDDFS